MRRKATKSPSEELSLSNCVIIRPEDLSSDKTPYIQFSSAPGNEFIVAIRNSTAIPTGTIGFNYAQREWSRISLNQDIELQPYRFSKSSLLAQVTFEVDFFIKKKATPESLNTDEIAKEFSINYPSFPLTKNQVLNISFKKKLLSLRVKKLIVADVSALKSDGDRKKNPSSLEANIGLTMANTEFSFEKVQESVINLVGSKKSGAGSQVSIINPDWNFKEMGIGGLNKEFSNIFRRAFASRVFPPDIVDQLGIKHVRGILLYGPPGTGKTLMARQIGKMLNAREPQIVNGPEILNKYVGESEANIRKLFAAAEEEQKRLGLNSGLHIIIFDEIDAICKQRGTASGSTGVGDTVVNQLLSKIDGVEQLNNILIIGMTNRKDLMDEALLRPGRLEVQMEIGLPNKDGRVEILKIHTNKLTENDKLDSSVDILELSKATKNFSGAEIEGLVRSAVSMAMNRYVKAKSTVEIDEDALNKLKISMDDFRNALLYDIKPYGQSCYEELLISYILLTGIVMWGDPVKYILDSGKLFCEQVERDVHSRTLNVLLSGSTGSGKTALAVKIAQQSGFPFVKITSKHNIPRHSDQAKVQALDKLFEDAYKSELSCIILDNLEVLLDYAPIGPRFCNPVLQILITLLGDTPPKNHRLLVIATTGELEFIELVRLAKQFHIVHVENLRTSEQVMAAVKVNKINVTKI
ncbi:uncharacterized protein TRIADDRAFT_22168 [Trichoplax adhaerens]|uniref:Vesicle-fusing ATPase n=1 Tax=Trichoplax adhaerens TaxID=10228 RepID=B3RRZ0_TRIAD|nr:hypothetical protein TRIADDRAFT_22168 [Trichoplax adhaerens]EDV26431.1 hypothetical protein TRIADDRAFT_22168 [Trichoplax adhaerens]|eukprot:XP_002110427.1 hypothetical protein TRIADDRAFT_22168 [Trichoplax adhaerens]